MTNVTNILRTAVDFEDKEALVCRIEVTDICVTVFGRVNDNPAIWAPRMQDLIKALGPLSTAHKSPSERLKFHPKGSFGKGTGYRYFHHVHSPHSLKTTLKLIDEWLPRDMQSNSDRIV